MPSKENIKSLILEVAHKEVIQRAQYVADCWNGIFRKSLADSKLSTLEGVSSAYQALEPTTKKVPGMLDAMLVTNAERAALDYFKRFVTGLEIPQLKCLLLGQMSFVFQNSRLISQSWRASKDAQSLMCVFVLWNCPRLSILMQNSVPNSSFSCKPIATSTEFKIRFRNHKSNMLNNRRTCELAVHFNSSQHDISQIRFIIIEQIISFKNPLHLDQLLLTREAYWMTQLFTLNPHGLNKRREFRSKNRINYSN